MRTLEYICKYYAYYIMHRVFITYSMYAYSLDSQILKISISPPYTIGKLLFKTEPLVVW